MEVTMKKFSQKISVNFTIVLESKKPITCTKQNGATITLKKAPLRKAAKP
jgi:hypothetical protein